MKAFLILGLTFLFIGCGHKNTQKTTVTTTTPATKLATPERYVLRPQLIQKLPGGENLNWGGFSALRFIARESTGDMLFWTLTDRGPNGEEMKKNNVVYRRFLMPNFHPSLLKIRASVSAKTLEVVEAIPMKNSTGEFLTGLPPENKEGSIPQFEVAVDMNNQVINNPAEIGIDSESIDIDEKNHFWVGEEYWPSIFEFDAQGTMLAHIQPARQPGVKLKKDEIPYAYRMRKSNRGFEALAYFKDHVYFMTQSPLNYETKPKFIRIGVFNTKTRHYEAEYLYPTEHHKADKIGDMQMIDEKHFLVIEQNSGSGPDSVHLVYKVDLTHATNRLTQKWKKEPELLSEKEFPHAFRFAQKTLFLDLVKQGYADFDKVEGLTSVDDKTIAVVNDNDFGVDGTKIIDRPTVLQIFNYSQDGKVN